MVSRARRFILPWRSGAFEATPLEIASAYTTFANDGTKVDPLAVRTITSNGEIVVSGAASKAGVMSSAIAYIVTDTLADVVNRGTAAGIRSQGYRGPAAGKTGTSRDAWFVGYTPNLLVVVWVGYDDNRDLKLTGGDAAVPIWVDFVKRALELRPHLRAERFVRPDGVQTVEMCTANGTLANEFCPHRQRVLIPNSSRQGVCSEHQEPLVMTIDDEGLSDELTMPVTAEATPKLIIRPHIP